MRPPPTRSRDWFRQQVAALGALVRTFPRRRQRALFEHLENETPAADTRAPRRESPQTPRRPSGRPDTPDTP